MILFVESHVFGKILSSGTKVQGKKASLKLTYSFTYLFENIFIEVLLRASSVGLIACPQRKIIILRYAMELLLVKSGTVYA